MTKELYNICQLIKCYEGVDSNDLRNNLLPKNPTSLSDMLRYISTTELAVTFYTENRTKQVVHSLL